VLENDEKRQSWMVHNVLVIALGGLVCVTVARSIQDAVGGGGIGGWIAVAAGVGLGLILMLGLVEQT
jgi:hypothetical protein